jgi:hypothetical protein
MIDSEYMSIAIWMTLIPRKHHDVGVGAWVDSILVPPIVVRGKVDPKCFVSIDDVVEHHKLCNVRWFHAETIK